MFDRFDFNFGKVLAADEELLFSETVHMIWRKPLTELLVPLIRL